MNTGSRNSANTDLLFLSSSYARGIESPRTSAKHGSGRSAVVLRTMADMEEVAIGHTIRRVTRMCDACLWHGLPAGGGTDGPSGRDCCCERKEAVGMRRRRTNAAKAMLVKRLWRTRLVKDSKKSS